MPDPEDSAIPKPPGDDLLRRMFPSASYAIALYIGLWLPDIDLAFLPLLHHRSILTHSILIPFLLHQWLNNKLTVDAISGLYCGIAIHMAADLLSPATGFGMIWLPWPTKISLGWFSHIWIGANAFLAFKISSDLCRLPKMLLFFGAAAAGLWYALINEDAVAPFLVFGLIMSGVYVLHRRKLFRAGTDGSTEPPAS
jgi:hypothetical protein